MPQEDPFIHPLLGTAEWESFTTSQREAIETVLHEARVARDANRTFLDTRTLGQRVADRIAAFGGSWTFIILFFTVLLAWVVINTEWLGPRNAAFDPYPYVFLNLMLSMLAAIQAPIIMMAQNRQAQRDRIEATNDYQVNLKAEFEIQRLHEKMDVLREAQWSELVRMQQEQIRMLQKLVDKGVADR
jgi:uncharacterized membrane protein